MYSVLIISVATDEHANIVEDLLKKRGGVNIIRLNTDRFIFDNFELSFGFDDNETLSILDKEVCLSDIKGVLYRRPSIPQVDVKLPGQKIFAEKEAEEFFRQLYFYLPNAIWVNPYYELIKARRKYIQLHVARNIGMRIPKTLITNSPKRIKSFFNICNKKMIYKTLHSPVIKDDYGPELWGVPTTLITDELMDKIDLIRPTGGIFQKYIEKDYEVRVTIIGGEIFSAKIDSQSDDSAKIDWRDAVAFDKVAVTPYILPSIVKQMCMKIIRDFGLVFGAIDLIKTLDNNYVFLELNPNGQWLWVEELTKQPLLASMANLLTSNCK